MEPKRKPQLALLAERWVTEIVHIAFLPSSFLTRLPVVKMVFLVLLSGVSSSSLCSSVLFVQVGGGQENIVDSLDCDVVHQTWIQQLKLLEVLNPPPPDPW